LNFDSLTPHSADPLENLAQEFLKQQNYSINRCIRIRPA